MAMLPEDVERGGVKLDVDTLQGTSLFVTATPTEIRISDNSQLTSDAIMVERDEIVCNSVINQISEVPLPFWLCCLEDGHYDIQTPHDDILYT